MMLSKHEAYGITVAEALAAGTPCIVARGSALEEFVDGVMCIGIEAPIKREEITNSLKQLTNGKLKNEITIKTVPIYDWDYVSNKMLAAYNS